MMIPCVSCGSMFRLGNYYVNAVGSKESDNSSILSIEPIEDFGDAEEDEHIEYAELPDLSEIEDIVDSILDERDHLMTIFPNNLAKYSLPQDLNFSGV